MTFWPSDPLSPIEVARPLTPPEVGLLNARVGEIANALHRRDPVEMARVVSQLLRQYPRKQDDRDAAAQIAGMVAVLAPIPTWAAAEAATNWLRGDVPGQNPGWPPTPDQIYQAALAIMQPFNIEAAKLRRTQEAKVAPKVVTSAEQRAAHVARLEAEHGPSMGMAAVEKEAKEKADAARREILDRDAARRPGYAESKPLPRIEGETFEQMQARYAAASVIPASDELRKVLGHYRAPVSP